MGEAIGEVHELPVSFASNPGDWRFVLQVEGSRAKFYQEGTADGGYVVLYTAPKRVSVTLSASYFGSLPDGVTVDHYQLEMSPLTGIPWSVDASTATTELDMNADRTSLNQVLAVHGTLKVITSNPLIQPSASCDVMLNVFRPLTVSAGYSGTVFSIYASKVIPYVQTNQNGGTYSSSDFTPVEGANVRAEPISGVTLGNSGWMTTDEYGRARTTASAPLSRVDENGFVNGQVHLKATKDGAGVEADKDFQIPFALIESANGAQLVGRAGALIDPTPLFSGNVLQPGDIVQVGSDVATEQMHLRIHFCNGEVGHLQAESFSGMRAQVTPDGLSAAQSVLKIDLKNKAVEAWSDPRRFGRMMVYKAIGNAVDSLLGTPDPVGWVTTTPGGQVEQWIAQWSESAYQPSPKGRPPGFAGSPALPPGAPWAAAWFDFYSDGTVHVTSQGASVRLSGPGGSRDIPRQGLAVAQLSTTNGVISDTGIHPGDGTLPTVTLTPANGAQNVSHTPVLKLNYQASADNPVMAGSLACRLDGRLITPPITLVDGEASYAVPDASALAAGPHVWEVAFNTLLGGEVRTNTTFTVTADLPAPTGLSAHAGLTNVTLTWSPDLVHLAPGGFRVYRSADGANYQPIHGPDPLHQPLFVDPAPLATAYYQVTALGAGSQESPPSDPVSVAFPGALPLPPPATTGLVVRAEAQGIGIEFDDSPPGAIGWQVERASQTNGPFADVLNGELLPGSGWLDTAADPNSNWWYRVSAVNVDGAYGTPALAGPVSWQPAPPPVTGLTVRLDSSGQVHLRWDPYHYERAALAGFKVLRSSGSGWTLAGTVGATELEWIETALPGGPLYQWQVIALLAGGGESPASPALPLRWQPRPAQPGVVKFAAPTFRGVEGDEVPIVIAREGGSDGPAFVTWSSYWGGGTANQGTDFEPRAGLVIFNDGETQKTVTVPLLSDGEFEFPEEFFMTQIRAVAGGPSTGDPQQVEVYIAESPVLAWAQTWLEAVEGPEITVPFVVTLSAPLTHPASVDYAFQPDQSTAVFGEDFTGPTSGTLHFAAGETNQRFVITLLDDAIKEGTIAEDIKYELQNPQGASIDTSDPFALVATLNVADDDTRAGHAVFIEDQIRVREGQSATLHVNRVDGADGPLDFMVFPQGGSAMSGPDFNLVPQFPQFAEGQTNLQLTLNAYADGESEGAETALLAAQVMGGFGPPQMSSVLVIIQDDPPMSSGFTNWAATALAAYPAADRRPMADADGDTVPNWMEYVWGTHADQADRLPLPEWSFEPWGGVVVTLTLVNDPAYTVVTEFSSDLSWTFPEVDAGEWTPDGPDRVKAVFRYYPPDPGMAFCRFHCYWLGEDAP